MDFGGALHTMMGGDKVARSSWNKGNYLGIQKPDDHSKMTRAYVYKQTGEMDCVPWVPGQEDMLADDWIVLSQ